MRVKKPTSKRTSTRMREGIKKKAAAQRRKEKKQSKKDVTWKSKHKKDPGIPASFPYKDRLLSQIEDTKRLEQEERQRKRSERKLEQLQGHEEEMMSEDDEDMEADEGNNLAALLESAEKAAEEFSGETAQEPMDEEDLEVVDYEISVSDDEANTQQEKSRKQFDKIFKSVVEASDVVLYILDARDPEATRSRKVEEAVLQNSSKRLIFVVNKVDLIPEDNLKTWLDYLKQSFPTIPLKASSGSTNAQSFNRKLTQAASASTLLQALKSYSQKSNLKRAIVVGVIGYPNVGKSSVINALTSRHGGSSNVCPVGNQAGVTTSLREVKIDNKLKILDSPGIVFPDTKKKNKQLQEAELVLLNSIPPKQVKDPLPPIKLLLKRLAKNTQMADGFKNFYQLPPLPSSDLDEFAKQVLIHIARKQGRLGKGGIPNLHSAGVTVLNDWRDGKIVGWTVPQPREEAKNISSVSKLSAPAKVEQTTVVKEWAKEFDLDALFAEVGV
ncbi:hypothetical protein OGAPHI_004048 [Ogataea philodendri]|uniref:CP-type G domain-containing protein n=1 Tax=Ogataea philodendri TaxID=1378263 RepID=A0A9P8P6C0_9ASCO|nr:uncharacterized protein OGAPHI_004048 [Ogataea philodendri]KAH3665860.1 hypothetical protein OGAPHI_004048 [Ogataea philodendri]